MCFFNKVGAIPGYQIQILSLKEGPALREISLGTLGSVARSLLVLKIFARTHSLIALNTVPSCTTFNLAMST